MKIASSELQMESSHYKLKQHGIRESLRTWVGDRRPDFEGNQRAHLPVLNSVQLSDAGKTVQSSEASTIKDSIDAAEKDPMLRLIIAMVVMLTGREVKVFDARELQVDSPAPAVQDPNQSSQSSSDQATEQAAAYGVEYDRHESYSELEQTRFAAAGVIRTEDGKEINFTVSLSMARSYHEQSDVSIRLGDARKTRDPLVLNFSGTSAQLTSQRFKFDLNSDGKSEDINFLTDGSGFLALDRNGDGKINNGSELFGTRSGNGFAELAVLDADHNGWIDENDVAYEKLRVWTRDGSGNDQLSTLKQLNVGALSLARVETPFDLKDSNNDLQGQIRSSGLFLFEDGKAGTLQQIDLTA